MSNDADSEEGIPLCATQNRVLVSGPNAVMVARVNPAPPPRAQLFTSTFQWRVVPWGTALHAFVFLALVCAVLTGRDVFLIVAMAGLVVLLCLMSQAWALRIVDWVLLGVLLLAVLYRDRDAIFEDILLVVFRVEPQSAPPPGNTTGTRTPVPVPGI